MKNSIENLIVGQNQFMRISIEFSQKLIAVKLSQQ